MSYQKAGWWVRAKAAHWSNIGPFVCAKDAAVYMDEQYPANDSDWSHRSITYKSTNR